MNAINESWRDSKSYLQELAQKTDGVTSTSVIKEEGPDHDRIFSANVVVAGHILCIFGSDIVSKARLMLPPRVSNIIKNTSTINFQPLGRLTFANNLSSRSRINLIAFRE